jgi:hypothetical protein
MWMMDDVKSISKSELRNVWTKPWNIQMFSMEYIVLLLQNQITL